jgi:predicted N-acyltransferase
VGPNDPFTRFEFLHALEQSGSVGDRTGWQPCHILVHEGGVLRGAMPLYAKHHSYGEYIFDWGWAQASQQAGLPYYPKLLGAVPFTPVTGRRLLLGEEPLDGEVGEALLGRLEALARTEDFSSFHLLFLTEAEQAVLAREPHRIARLTHQYHWQNAGYRDFQDWQSNFRSRCRKEVRRERSRAEALGVEVTMRRGPDMEEAHWQAIHAFYQDTLERKGAYHYLTPDFFVRMREDLAPMVVAFFAEGPEGVVASSLCFQRGDHLYGRYWGCLPAYRGLHFELCYHQPIAACIAQGWTRFEAGAQGPHKVRRGLLPAPTYSIHWIKHPGLAEAVARATVQEREMQAAEMAYMAARSPFKRGSSDD